MKTETSLADTLPALSRLIQQHGFELMCWDDRYSRGIWAVCLPGYNQCQAVRDASEDGDLDMIPATDFLLDCGWLPVVTGRTLFGALSSLESRLLQLGSEQQQRGSAWCTATNKALEHLQLIRRSSQRYGDSMGRYRVLPEDFHQVAQEASW